MSVFSSVKKAFNQIQIPQFLRDGGEPRAWESEGDPYKRDILRLSQVFTDEGSLGKISNTNQIKEDVLREIGHIAYLGKSKLYSQ